MPTGVHRDKPLHTIPNDYLVAFLTYRGLPGPLRRVIRRYLAQHHVRLAMWEAGMLGENEPKPAAPITVMDQLEELKRLVDKRVESLKGKVVKWGAWR